HRVRQQYDLGDLVAAGARGDDRARTNQDRTRRAGTASLTAAARTPADSTPAAARRRGENELLQLEVLEHAPDHGVRVGVLAGDRCARTRCRCWCDRGFLILAKSCLELVDARQRIFLERGEDLRRLRRGWAAGRTW